MKKELKVGQLALHKTYYVEVEITEVHRNTDGSLSYYRGVPEDAPEKESFMYHPQDLEDWHPRRFVRLRDHSKVLGTPRGEATEMLYPEGVGTIAIFDTRVGQVLFYLSSAAAYWQSIEILRALNNNTLMSDYIKRCDAA